MTQTANYSGRAYTTLCHGGENAGAGVIGLLWWLLRFPGEQRGYSISFVSLVEQFDLWSALLNGGQRSSTRQSNPLCMVDYFLPAQRRHSCPPKFGPRFFRYPCLGVPGLRYPLVVSCAAAPLVVRPNTTLVVPVVKDGIVVAMFLRKILVGVVLVGVGAVVVVVLTWHFVAAAGLAS